MATSPVIFRGIKFPFQKGSTSFPAAVSDEDVIRESLLQLVLTMSRERIMRPDFGCNALTFVFENNDVVLGNLLRSEIQGVVAKFEPRVQITDIRVERQEAEVVLTMVYVILSSKRVSATSVYLPTP